MLSDQRPDLSDRVIECRVLMKSLSSRMVIVASLIAGRMKGLGDGAWSDLVPLVGVRSIVGGGWEK